MKATYLQPVLTAARPTTPPACLTMGPVVFNWAPQKWRDFYFRIADEAPVDMVYIGEVVCAKRLPFLAPVLPDVMARLAAAGKEVVLSTLALNMNRRELNLLREMASEEAVLVEANDIAALSLLNGRPHIVGPYVNVYNEGTLDLLAKGGAIRVVLPAELPGSSIALLIETGVPLEIQVFGRMPLAISARCYHARAENLHKDGCRFVCERDPDGLSVDTLDGEPFLAVNGLQTLSHGCLNLGQHMMDLVCKGIRHFRLQPHMMDMVEVARLYRNLLDGHLSADELAATLPRPDGAAFVDGFYRGIPGLSAMEM
ncbi:MAG: U32 family peptidase [Proteobacteria bacterium]|nr:U32 family peptidase [Pseudomonadota bacterium]